MSYEPETNAPSSPFHPSGNRTPERRRKPSEYSREHHDRMYEADTRSNASPFHPFKSPSPSPYHTPDRRRDHDTDDYEYEAMYEPEANTIFEKRSPFHPARSRSPSPYTTPDRRRNHPDNEQFEDLYERDGDVTPRNSSPPSPFHPAASRSPPPQPYTTHDNEEMEAMYEADGDVMRRSRGVHGGAAAYYSSSDDDDNHSTYLFPEIATPTRSANTTPVHHNYQMVAAESYEQEKPCDEPPELTDESQSFTVQEMARMRGYEKEEESQLSIISSEAYVSVASYRVRQSVAETLKAILDKHGDIAASSKLQSTMTRSYYLESLAAVVMELRSTGLRDLTKTRVEEMAAVVKDMEAVRIQVSWLKKAMAELGEAVKYLDEYEAAKAEREVCEREAKAGKQEMEEMTAELERRDKDIRDCRERVTAVAGKLGQLQMKGSSLNKKLELFHSKVHQFQGDAVLLHL
ncbi:uncharacterized protein LOC18028370 isoform X2 [Eutrema salsugineum]|nr:uncharacterized protein LOC18028370 isoform X2 [Eutrema salsugineum]